MEKRKFMQKLFGYDKSEMGQFFKDLLFSAGVLIAVFLINLGIHSVIKTATIIPTIFVLGIFFIACKTQGYVISIACSIICVFTVNFAFTIPYNAFDLISPEYLFAAIAMLIISVITGALTTKLKEQEKQRADSEREKMRANLLRAISHDLRTPLTSIYGSTSVVIENYDSLTRENKLELLNKTREDAQWLIRMVENLLSVTRFDKGNVAIIKTPTVLEELIDAVITKFHKRYAGHEVNVDIPEDFISIPMDALLIEQVLINLLENAVFHAKGMKTLSLNVKLAGNSALFSVEDDGCGIPKERLPQLFCGYMNTGEASSDSSRHGMGIGLSVCDAIIKAHGSEIFAENRKNGGAKFSFALKLEEE